MRTHPSIPSPLPARFHLWWAASTLQSAGGSMLGFALIWLATGHGPGAVALVSMLSVLPPVALMLLGGVLGDRHGPRRMLLVTMGAELIVLIPLLAVSGGDPTVTLLATAAVTTSTISAISRPSATVYARLLIRSDD